MNVLVLVAVVVFYAVVGGIAVETVHKLHVRTTDGAQNPPNVVAAPTLPDGQVDGVAVYGLSYCFQWEPLIVLPLAETQALDQTIVHPVIVVSADANGVVTLGITSDANWTNSVEMFPTGASLFNCIDWYDSPPADITATLMYSKDFVT